MRFWSVLLKRFIPTVICTFQDKTRVCIYVRGKFLSRATLTRLAPFPQHCSFPNDAAPQCCECIWLCLACQLHALSWCGDAK
uniref:Putative secreted protein n=1 Tax=Ixodes ricinus TaxID=34613 RepID=A0A147BFD5_IXORI